MNDARFVHVVVQPRSRVSTEASGTKSAVPRLTKSVARGHRTKGAALHRTVFKQALESQPVAPDQHCPDRRARSPLAWHSQTERSVKTGGWSKEAVGPKRHRPGPCLRCGGRQVRGMYNAGQPKSQGGNDPLIGLHVRGTCLESLHTMEISAESFVDFVSAFDGERTRKNRRQRDAMRGSSFRDVQLFGLKGHVSPSGSTLPSRSPPFLRCVARIPDRSKTVSTGQAFRRFRCLSCRVARQARS